MQDLLLWRFLRDETLPDPAQLVPLLHELARLTLTQRAAFFGVLERVLLHEDAEVRSAALGVLGGAQGIPAWRCLVAGLKDTTPSVRQAAVNALRASADFDPGRWIHALFHPDPDVRRRAQEAGAPHGFGSLFPVSVSCSEKEAPTTPMKSEIWSESWDGEVPAEEFQKVQDAMSPFQPDILKSFLERGSEVPAHQRLPVAECLSRNGHTGSVLPILLKGLSPDLLNVTAEEFAIAAHGIVTLGSQDTENTFTEGLYDRNFQPEDETALTVLITQATGMDARYWARDRIGTMSAARTLALARLARTFAWGVAMGRYLTGELFQIEMLVNDQELGYTRLREKKLHITPLPILRRERAGTDIVRGLILHEYGHHLYHKGDKAEAVWKQADETGLGRLLNLVADEHLERNLRQRSVRYGDLLKTLTSYAFQHSMREVPVESLLRYLGGQAHEVLPRVNLAAARKHGHVIVASGRLLREMESAGHSFARFLRALRMGLGNRTGDPRVAQGLALFKSGFRHSTMPQLLDTARRLREIFGDEADMLNDFGLERAMAGDEAEWLASGQNITQAGVQQAVDSLLQAPEDKKNERRGPGEMSSWGLNVRPEETFKPITNILKLPHNPVRHAEYAQRVARSARLLRRYFQDLGLGLRPQRARLQGRHFDRTRARALILRADPRILIARKLERTTDLFLGVAIDCSGSMYGNNLEKGRLFGTLLAEALKGCPGVDLRLFGFTDRTIFDAGSARMCAVHALESRDGNNDSAALWHVYRIAKASRRRAKLLVMISDGLPTECSVQSLKALVARLTHWHYCCAQVAVRPLEQICFPHYVLLPDEGFDASVRKFGEVVMRLVGRALGQG